MSAAPTDPEIIIGVPTDEAILIPSKLDQDPNPDPKTNPDLPCSLHVWVHSTNPVNITIIDHEKNPHSPSTSQPHPATKPDKVSVDGFDLMYEVFLFDTIPLKVVGHHVKVLVAENGGTSHARLIPVRKAYPRSVRQDTPGVHRVINLLTLSYPGLSSTTSMVVQPSLMIVGKVDPSDAAMSAWAIDTTHSPQTSIPGTPTTPPSGFNWAFAFGLSSNTYYSLYIQATSGGDSKTIGAYLCNTP